MNKWFYFVFFGFVCAVVIMGIFLLAEYESKTLLSDNPLVCEDHYPCYTVAMQNISDKCGVLGSDSLWGTAMKKISDCLNRLVDIKSIDINIDGFQYHIPPSKATYKFYTNDLCNSIKQK